MKYVAYSREDETFSEFLDQLKKQGPDVSLVSAQFSDLDDTRCCLLYTSPSPRDVEESRMPSSA